MTKSLVISQARKNTVVPAQHKKAGRQLQACLLPCLIAAVAFSLDGTGSAHADESEALPQAASTYAIPDENKNRGWEGLAKLLDKITPSVDTELRLSGQQITDNIATLINRGQPEQALVLIKKREQELARSTAPGTDVQLMFQKARALDALGKTDQAREIYEHMTLRYPELVEPWNNLALILIKQGDMEKAAQALQVAIMNDPSNADAKNNLAIIEKFLHPGQGATASAGLSPNDIKQAGKQPDGISKN